jgi:hypothetical protein
VRLVATNDRAANDMKLFGTLCQIRERLLNGAVENQRVACALPECPNVRINDTEMGKSR